LVNGLRMTIGTELSKPRSGKSLRSYWMPPTDAAFANIVIIGLGLIRFPPSPMRSVKPCHRHASPALTAIRRVRARL
jgi:hypothetical protein